MVCVNHGKNFQNFLQKPDKLSCRLESNGYNTRMTTTTTQTKGNEMTKTENTFRRDVLACLRRLGFRRETKTKSGSLYYVHGHAGVRVRVSDHEVPMTEEREANGGGWRLGWNVLVGDGFEPIDAARELVNIRRDVRRQLRLQSR